MPLKMTLVNTELVLIVLYKPPPAEEAELLRNITRVRVRLVELEMTIPPPLAAELPLKVISVNVELPFPNIPAPKLAAILPLKRMWISVGLPLLTTIPPPRS